MYHGEILRTRIAQSKRRPAPIVSQHHVRLGQGVSSTTYRGSRIAVLWHGKRSDKSRRHHRRISRGNKAWCDHREYHTMLDRIRLGRVRGWKIAPKSWYRAISK